MVFSQLHMRIFLLLIFILKPFVEAALEDTIVTYRFNLAFDELFHNMKSYDMLPIKNSDTIYQSPGVRAVASKA